MRTESLQFLQTAGHSQAGVHFHCNCLTLPSVLPSFGAYFATLDQIISISTSTLSQGVSMHIEPGVVQGAKLLLGFCTALTAFGLILRQCWEFLIQHGLNTLIGRTIFTSVLVFSFFEILPSSHKTKGVLLSVWAHDTSSTMIPVMPRSEYRCFTKSPTFTDNFHVFLTDIERMRPSSD